MTWYYDIAADSSSMDVYDHTGTLVDTITNDGSGFRFPDDVLDVMKSEFDTAMANNNTPRAIEIAGDAAFEQIEEGTSP